MGFSWDRFCLGCRCGTARKLKCTTVLCLCWTGRKEMEDAGCAGMSEISCGATPGAGRGSDPEVGLYARRSARETSEND